MFLVTLDKKVVYNPKILRHLVKLFIFSNVDDFLLSLKTVKKTC